MAEEEKENTSSGTDEDMNLGDDQVIALATLGATPGPPSEAELKAYLGKIADLQKAASHRG